VAPWIVLRPLMPQVNVWAGAVAIGWPLGAWAFQSVTGPTLDFLLRSTSGMK
jgi:hypothetical protein